MNKEFLICYGFTFNISARSKKGKVYKAHRIAAVGLSYSLAYWDMETTLKRRGMQLDSINSVTVERIEFALDNQGQAVQISLSDYMPSIPENINHKLGHYDP